MVLRVRNLHQLERYAPWLGVVVQPDEVVTVPDDIEAQFTAGQLLLDTSSWDVVEGSVPDPPAPPPAPDAEAAPAEETPTRSARRRSE